MTGISSRIFAKIVSEYNEMQCDKRNTYRRKVKEEKAAAAVPSEGEAPEEGGASGIANGTVNGHAEVTEADDGERPSKKFKAEDGTGMAPDPDVTEDDEMDDAHPGEPDTDEQHEEDDVGEESDDDEGEDEDEGDEGIAFVKVHELDDLTVANELRDEALDDPDGDSE